MKIKRVSALAAVVITLSSLVASCGGGDSKNTGSVGGVQSVDLTPSSASAHWGKTIRVSAQTTYATGASVIDQTITYISSNENVATVSSTGVVTLLNPGTTNVTATVGGVVSKASVINSKGFAFDTLSVKQNDNCSLDDTKTEILCWGDGYPIRENLPLVELRYPSPMKLLMGSIPSGATLKQVEPGFMYSCSLTSDGSVYCWQGAARDVSEISGMGTNSQTPTGQPALVQRGEIPAGAKITKLIQGAYSSCVLVDDGNVYCWGGIYSTPRPEKLWSNSSSHYTYPVKIGVIDKGVKFIDYAKGGERDCGLTDTGKVYCANHGDNNSSAYLTQKTHVSSEVPVNVKLIKIKSGSSTSDFMMTLGDDGWIYSFGGGFGRLYGNGSSSFIGTKDTNQLIRPAQGEIPLGVKIVDFSAGSISSVRCVVGDNARAYCWGNGFQGSAGDGNMENHEILTPKLVLQGQLPKGINISNIACGLYHCSALATDRKVYAWGYGEGAAIGGTVSVAVPTLVNKVGN